MKCLFTSLSVLLSLHSFSQTRNYKVTELSVVSPNMDTLWLMNNSTGLLIARSWDMGSNTEFQKPVIIITDILPNPNPTNDTKKNRKKRYIRGKK